MWLPPLRIRLLQWDTGVSGWAADSTFVKHLDLSAYAGLGTDHLVRVYVTVKDEADAVLPEDLYWSYTNSRNWLAFDVVQEQVGLLTVTDGGAVGRRHSHADY